jgi:RNA polymerase sigma-70 factor (TIGR02960 family)
VSILVNRDVSTYVRSPGGGWTVNRELLARARAGDGQAFAELVDPFRRELHVHCYRMLGSAQDAEDALQETLLAAWQGLRGFEERASMRTWLYRIATSRCLNARRSASRRPKAGPSVGFDLPEPSGLGEVVWLQPYPEQFLEELPGGAAGPEAHYEAREAVSLAFITAMQLLPARQRAVLILRDVLGYTTHEVAAMLETTEQATASALKRARATLRREVGPSRHQLPPPAPNSPAERKLVAEFTRAYATADVQRLINLLTDDVELVMPPWPFQYRGRGPAAQFHTAVTFREGRTYRLIPTRANGQPAFALYTRDPHARVLHANGLMVLTLAGDHISALTRFDNSVLPTFGLPRSLPG